MPRLNLALTPLVIPANEVWAFVANKRDLDVCFAHDDKLFAPSVFGTHALSRIVSTTLRDGLTRRF
jgi:hypothetical protein